MRKIKIILICCCFCLFMICCKTDSKDARIEHIKTELAGCAEKFDLEDDDMQNIYPKIDDVIVTITISEDSFNVFVGIEFTCKVEPFETEVEIIDDILCMHIKDICYDQDNNKEICGYARCYCSYTFDFAFNYQGELNQKYKILFHRGLAPEGIFILSEGIIN